MINRRPERHDYHARCLEDVVVPREFAARQPTRESEIAMRVKQGTGLLCLNRQ